MFIKTHSTMIFTNYTKTETYYEFNGEDGVKLIAPVGSIILVDDQSGALSIKSVSSRCTIGIVPKQ